MNETAEYQQEIQNASKSFVRYCAFMRKNGVAVDEALAAKLMQWYITPIPADEALKKIKERMQ